MDNHQQNTFRVNLNINDLDNNNGCDNSNNSVNNNSINNNSVNNTSVNNTTNNFIETTNFIDNLYKSISSNTTTQILTLTTVSHLLIQTIRK